MSVKIEGAMKGTVVGYKLFRLRRDGTLGPLFINRRQVVPVDTWLDAEAHPTKGFAVRPGWHGTLIPWAPHLAQRLKNGERRVWCQVEFQGARVYERPWNQGGTWILAERMRVVRILSEGQVQELCRAHGLPA